MEDKVTINNVEHFVKDFDEESNLLYGYIVEIQNELNVLKKRGNILDTALRSYSKTLADRLENKEE